MNDVTWSRIKSAFKSATLLSIIFSLLALPVTAAVPYDRTADWGLEAHDCTDDTPWAENGGGGEEATQSGTCNMSVRIALLLIDMELFGPNEASRATESNSSENSSGNAGQDFEDLK